MVRVDSSAVPRGGRGRVRVPRVVPARFGGRASSAASATQSRTAERRGDRIRRGAFRLGPDERRDDRQGGFLPAAVSGGARKGCAMSGEWSGWYEGGAGQGSGGADGGGAGVGAGARDRGALGAAGARLRGGRIGAG